MIKTTLELSEEQRKDWIRKLGALPVDPVAYAWQRTYGEDAEIPKKIRVVTLMDLYASRLRESNRVGGRKAAKRYGETA